MAKKDTIIDPEWEKDNELKGRWGTRPRPRRDEPEDLDPFGVDKPSHAPGTEPEFVIEPKAFRDAETNKPAPQPEPQESPFDPDPPHKGKDRPGPEPAAESDPFAAPQEKERSKMAEYLGMILSGSILTKAEVRRVYPYMLFIAFLMLIYISSLFRMQQLHRREIELTRQVKELRATSLELASRRMNATRQSNILLELEKREIPLRESLTPPKIVK